MHSNINLREDAYGGDYQKRCRFLLEVVHAMSDAIGSDRVGVRLAPFGLFNDVSLNCWPLDYAELFCRHEAQKDLNSGPIFVAC